MQLQFRVRFLDELKQKEAVTDSLIKKILYSKRLLIDHVDALEQCLSRAQMRHRALAHDDSPAALKSSKLQKLSQGEILTARNACVLLGSTLVEHLFTPRALRIILVPSVLITSSFSAFYLMKNVFVFRNKMVERSLENLIRTIDEFGNCIRRNMTYFNEILIMKQQELIESRQIERAWDCITAAKEVTEILYDATRKLESQYPLPAEYSEYYSPMAELRECDYFKNNVTDYSPKQIKDFHNIFAYIQSQYLLRLALTISTKPSISELNIDLVKIDCLIHQLVQEEEHHFQNLTIELNKKAQLEVDALNSTRAMQNLQGPVAVLQNSSLKLSACMVAVASQCQNLDITLQHLTKAETEHKDNTTQLVQVANNMHSIENALSVCFDDFQRLRLVYSKFLSSKLDTKEEDTGSSDRRISAADDEYPESFLRVEISENSNDAQKKDDFFAYMFDEQRVKNEDDQQQGRKPTREMEILNFEKNITRSKFRPVLKQLKNRIDPIRKEMLEKERQVLAAKGINVDELFEKDDGAPETADKETSCMNMTNATQRSDGSGSDSEGSADFEYERRMKVLKERDNYAERRHFLAQKQAINLFRLQPPAVTHTAGSEQILESDC